MTERDIELREQAWTLISNEERTQGELYETRERWKKCDQMFADLIRADERKHLEAELLKLKDGVAASSDYIQGRWNLIGEFQDVIRARGQA